MVLFIWCFCLFQILIPGTCIISNTFFWYGSYIEFNTHLLYESRFGHSPPWMKFQLIRTTYCMLTKGLTFPSFLLRLRGFSYYPPMYSVSFASHFKVIIQHCYHFLLFYIPFYQCYPFRLTCRYFSEGEFVCSSPLDWHVVNDMEVFQTFRT